MTKLNNTIIIIKFKDTGKEVKIDSSTNNVFFGVNGRGKTRVLKTIYLLDKLTKEQKLSSFSEIIEEMNLSELKIGTKFLKEIVNTSIKYRRDQLEAESFFITSEKSVLLLIQNNLLNLINYLKYIEKSSISADRIVRLYNSGELILEEKNNNSSRLTLYKYLSDARFIINQLKRNEFLISEDSNFNILKELEDDIEYLSSKYRKNSDNLEYTSRIINEKTKSEIELIKDYFSDKNVKFLKTELNENMFIFSSIKEMVQRINEKVVQNLWNNKTIVDNKKVNLYDLSDEIQRINEKVNIFNNTIQRYENIRINLKYDGILEYQKNENLIQFDKLSSGEKRLIIILITAVFFDRDLLLIDEPEISLSLNYQSKIIFDLMRIKKNNMMIATHAPFVYEDFIGYSENIGIEV